MLTNRPEFHWFDSAALHAGATPFSIYNTYAREQIQYQVLDAGARIVVTESAFLDQVGGLDGVEHLVVVDGDGPEGSLSIADVEAAGSPDFDFESAWRAVGADDLLTLIYTSGTTGPPKGVQLTHENLLSAVRGFDDVIAFPDEGRVISWLPMAHIAERSCSHYLPMVLGFSTTCCQDPRQVVAYLPEVRPTWFFAVPRIWEKLKAAIEAGVAAEQDEERKKATEWALDVGLRKVRADQAGEELSEELRAEHAKADELVLSKIRGRLGLDRGGVGERGRRAHAARGDRVLPRHRRAAGGALGDVRDLRVRHLQPAGPHQDRHGGPGLAGRGDHSWPTTARCSCAARWS